MNNFKVNNKVKFFCIFALFISSLNGEDSLATNERIYVKHILSLAKSSEMRSFMNPNVNPCSDFYEFACGNWAKINPINRAQRQTSTLEILKRTYERKIFMFLNSNSSVNEFLADRKVKTFYKSCKLAFDSFDPNGLHALLSDLGSMPLLAGDNWNETKFDWLDLLTRIKRDFGLQILIGLDVSVDLMHSSIHRLFLGQPALKLGSKSLYLDEAGLPYRNAYRDEVALNLQKFTPLPRSYATHTAEEIVGFEILLAKGLTENHANISRNDITTETTVDELQSKYAPTLDIKRLLNLTLGYIPSGPVYEFNKQYLKNLKYVLETTNSRLLANYMFYMLLQEFLPSNGLKRKQSNKEIYCHQKAKEHFSKLLANVIYRKSNIAAAEDDVKAMWHGLRKAFKSKLYTKNLDWISPVVRQYAEQKLNDMHMEIDAYEDHSFSSEYHNLTITVNDYVKNLQQIYQFETNEKFQKINKPSTYYDDDHYDLAIPFNLLNKNTVKLPVMLLQPYVLWAAHYPMAVKFGTLGFLIARALIHGFDDKGRLYNKRGETENWWDESTINAFMNRRDCFLKQYPVFAKEIPNLNAVSENIADNAGLNLAFEAFKDWLKSEASSTEISLHEALPLMSYTNEQIFFISFAQLLCNDVGPTFRPSFEQHISGRFRVNGALMNSKYFSKTFNCGPKDAMNPMETCEMF